jgi:protease II
MIHYKGGLTVEEERNISNSILTAQDEYKDFYITKNNERLYGKKLISTLMKQLRKGDKIIFDDSYKSMLLLVGMAEKSNRIYLKILGDSEKTIANLMMVMFWNINKEIYVKLKKNNPLISFLTSFFYFSYVGSRDREVLLRRLRDDRNRSFNASENRD